ncbi:hypothetical protein HCU40_07235 [Pseudanabaena biceps]|nr:hypothetical protein [Pseudanabaena biceps]
MSNPAVANSLAEDFGGVTPVPVPSLANIWAKKYIQNLQSSSAKSELQAHSLEEILSSEGRIETATHLQNSLRFATAQAWARTENLLIGQNRSHGIDDELIDPWQIATDSRNLFEQTFKIYTDNAQSRIFSFDLATEGQDSHYFESKTQLPTTGQLSVAIASNVGKIRKKYTSIDPRAIGFVSMQFHYSGQILLESLAPLEQLVVSSYFKVIDDHLYMPLQRCYDAAGYLEYDDAKMQAVRSLLTLTTSIAIGVSQKTLVMHSDYQCHSGVLSLPQVRISSLRDIEMFQVYLCLCVLEQSVSPIQQELFPICIMLYPPLKVSWELVRTLLRLLEQEMHDHLGDLYMQEFEPYLTALNEMFGDDVLPEA